MKYRFFPYLLVFLIFASFSSPVRAADLTIDSISPTFSYSNTDYNFIMKITGWGFVGGTQVEIFYPTFGFNEPQVKSVVIISGNELRAEVEVPYDTPAGFYNVKVTSPDGFTSVTKEKIFELKKKSSPTYFYPVITTVNPPTAPEGSSRNIIIKGEQFAGTCPLVRLIQTDGPHYFDIDATRLNHMEIHATVPDTIPVGTYDVLVRGTGGYGGNQYIKSSALMVEPAPEPEPPSNGAGAEPEEPETPSEPQVGVPQPPANPPVSIPPAYLFDYRAGFVDQNGTVGVGSDGILTHIVQGSRGSDIDMWVKFKNASSRQWWYENPADPDSIHQIRLGLTKDALSNFTHNSWISTNRLTKIEGNVAPGETATLNFKIHISQNLAPGAYKLSVGLVAEWIKWMYDDVHWEVRVV